MTRKRVSLDVLPDDILYLILENLDTARDRARVCRTCQKLYRFMQGTGWRTFIKQSFPGVFSGNNNDSTANSNHIQQVDAGIAADGHGASGWSQLAESLTWQSRAWDRRAVSFKALLPRWEHIPHRARPRQYQPSLAVHFQPEGGKKYGIGTDGEEMLIWGAGEDVIARYRKRGRRGARGASASNATWRVFDGKKAGYRPGYDDVRATSVVENAMGRFGYRGCLTGRDSGDLSLLSAETDGSFGQILARFLPDPAEGGDYGCRKQSGTPVDQTRIYTIDVSGIGRTAKSLGCSSSELVAVTTPSHIVFYPLPHTDDESLYSGLSSLSVRDQFDGSGHDGHSAATNVFPVAAFDMGDIGRNERGGRQSYNARWMAADGVLAVGMGVGESPLRYLTITPTGVTELTTAYKLPNLRQHFHLDDMSRLKPTALEPIAPSIITGGNGYMVLSAWGDGTCRLQDLRTASPWDLIYQDNIMGSMDCAQALLVQGTDRFIAGNQASAALKIFDLRWPRRYYHTAALPCTDALPYPTPPMPPPPRAPNHHLPSLLPSAQRTASSPSVPLFSQPPPPPLPKHLPATTRCDPLRSIHCRWHAASRDLFYRSNCTFHLQRSLARHSYNTGVWALQSAVPSDLAPANFYAGLSSCIVEASLSEDVPPELYTSSAHATAIGLQDDPHFGYNTSTVRHHSEDDGYYRTVDLTVAAMETGDGMAQANVEQRPMRLPRIRTQHGTSGTMEGLGAARTSNLDGRDRSVRRSRAMNDTMGSAAAAWRRDEEAQLGRRLADMPLLWRQRHRLDYGLQLPEDFSGLTAAA